MEIINLNEPVQITGRGENAVLFFNINGDLAKKKLLYDRQGNFQLQYGAFLQLQSGCEDAVGVKGTAQRDLHLLSEKDARICTCL